MNSRWNKFFLYATLIIVGGGLLFILIETVKAKNTGFETKSLWDWMELLIIPAFLAGGAFFLNRSERNTEREIATDRQQEAALQAYLDRMADSLLKEKLLTTRNKEVRNVARIRTLTVLRGLDGKRKGLVLLFLYEAGLISIKKPIINLSGADLEYANLLSANLSGANLQEADLSYAFLLNANLSGANLSEAYLVRTILEDADLSGANLKHAILHNADLSGANLRGVKDVNEQLAFVFSLKYATMPDGTKYQ